MLSSAVQPGRNVGGLAGLVILYCRNTQVGSSSGSRGGPLGPDPSEEACEVQDPIEVQDP